MKQHEEHERHRIGATLRAMREARGYTPDQFANELAISRSYLTNIELGAKRLTPVLLSRAANALDVPQIALIREGYFDVEQAEYDLHLRQLRAERDDALEQVAGLLSTVSALEKRLQEIKIPAPAHELQGVGA